MSSAGFGLARADGRQSDRALKGRCVTVQCRRLIPSFTGPLVQKLLDRAPENCGLKLAKVTGSDLRKLLDEWQLAPQLWNEVRCQVDKRSPEKGQFILTGSSTPDDDARRHSGPGRFVRLRMCPLSVFELERSSGAVSFASLMSGQEVGGVGAPLAVPELARVIAVGGWPGSLELADKAAEVVNQGYVDQIVETDLPRLIGRRRDPVKLRNLLSALARSVGNQIAVSKLAQEAGGER